MKTIKRYLGLSLYVLMLCAAALTSHAEESNLNVTGAVTEIEKYGHIVLDIEIEDFENTGFELGDIVTVSTGDFVGDMPYFNGYYVDKGDYLLRAYPGTENIAVCIN